jgi:hypothetical protein
MASIVISELYPVGFELFSDSESYMSELGDNELVRVNGGIVTTPVCAAAVVSSVKCAGYAALAAGAFAGSYLWAYNS